MSEPLAAGHDHRPPGRIEPAFVGRDRRKCEVVKHIDGPRPTASRPARRFVLAVLEPYGQFGEMSFFYPAPHSAEVQGPNGRPAAADFVYRLQGFDRRRSQRGLQTFAQRRRKPWPTPAADGRLDCRTAGPPARRRQPIAEWSVPRKAVQQLEFVSGNDEWSKAECLKNDEGRMTKWPTVRHCGCGGPPACGFAFRRHAGVLKPPSAPPLPSTPALPRQHPRGSRRDASRPGSLAGRSTASAGRAPSAARRIHRPCPAPDRRGKSRCSCRSRRGEATGRRFARMAAANRRALAWSSARRSMWCSRAYSAAAAMMPACRMPPPNSFPMPAGALDQLLAGPPIAEPTGAPSPLLKQTLTVSKCWAQSVGRNAGGHRRRSTAGPRPDAWPGRGRWPKRRCRRPFEG